jgi:hypothetical protein
MGVSLMACGGDVVVCPEPDPVPEPAPAERVRVVMYVDAVPGEDTVAVVQCPTGSTLVAGGCVLGASRDEMTLVASVPENPQASGEDPVPAVASWVCIAWTQEGVDGALLEADAVCEVGP